MSETTNDDPMLDGDYCTRPECRNIEWGECPHDRQEPAPTRAPASEPAAWRALADEASTLADAATPGPWDVSAHEPSPTTGDWMVLEHEHGIYPPLGESGPVAICGGQENGAFIGSARTLVPRLAAALRAAAATVGEHDRILRSADLATAYWQERAERAEREARAAAADRERLAREVTEVEHQRDQALAELDRWQAAHDAREAEADALRADAERWRYVRQCLDVDGDFADGEGDGPHVQWIRADDEKLCDIAQPGWTWTVEGLIDAALAAPADAEVGRG